MALEDQAQPTRRTFSSIPVPLDAAGVGLSWEFICEASPVSRALYLRALVQLLHSLSTLHTDVSKSPAERFHGSICGSNVLFRSDASVLLARGSESKRSLPSAYEGRSNPRNRPQGDQADLYAVAVMLLEAIVGRGVPREEVINLQVIQPAVPPFFAEYATDPLFKVALRGLAITPAQRWLSAREFADAILDAGGPRVALKTDLEQLVQRTLSQQGERATPVQQEPYALALPKPPTAPGLDSFGTSTREPSYAPGSLTDASDLSVAVSQEPAGLIVLAKAPAPMALNRARWAAATAVGVALGAVVWGISKLLGPSDQDAGPPTAEAPSSISEPSLAERAVPAQLAKSANAIGLTVESALAKGAPVASTQNLPPPALPTGQQAATRLSSPSPTIAGKDTPQPKPSPRAAATRTRHVANSPYDPEGI